MLDQGDIADLQSAIAGSPCTGCDENADVNHDGVADQDDLAAMIVLVASGANRREPCNAGRVVLMTINSMAGRTIKLEV